MMEVGAPFASARARVWAFVRGDYARGFFRSVAGQSLAVIILIDATWTKQPGHGISTRTFIQPERPMSAIGG